MLALLRFPLKGHITKFNRRRERVAVEFEIGAMDKEDMS